MSSRSHLEHAPSGRRHRYARFLQMGTPAGLVPASVSGAVARHGSTVDVHSGPPWAAWKAGLFPLLNAKSPAVIVADTFPANARSARRRSLGGLTLPVAA